jgi:signal transduction histidine kinase
MLCGEKFKHRNVEIRVDPIADDLAIRCRSVQISQVLLNLINNACDAVQSDPAPWIHIAAERRDGFVRLTVTDSGKGIPEHVRSRLFQPFFTTKEIGKGTGLGLSISKGIVGAHGGTVDLDPTSAHTRFVVELPAGVDAVDPVPKPRSA